MNIHDIAESLLRSRSTAPLFFAASRPWLLRLAARATLESPRSREVIDAKESDGILVVASGVVSVANRVPWEVGDAGVIAPPQSFLHTKLGMFVETQATVAAGARYWWIETARARDLYRRAFRSF